MTHIPLTLCLLALAGCAVFEPVPVADADRSQCFVLRDDAGNPVPACRHFVDNLRDYCGGARACATYYQLPDGSMSILQRCDMYFNAADYTPWLKHHEEQHCLYGDTHPRTRRQGLGQLGIQ